MDIGALQLHPGSRCHVRAEVLAIGDHVVLRAPAPVAAPAYAPGHEPAPTSGHFSVPVTGVDLRRLSQRHTGPDGSWVRGTADVRGTWRGTHLEVDEQAPLTTDALHAASRAAVLSSPWTTPPCPEPDGGWGSASHVPWPDELGDFARVLAEASVVNVTVFSPPSAGPVTVYAAEDPARAAAVLAPVLGRSACVVLSRCSSATVQTAERTLVDNMQPWLAWSAGRSSDAEGQAVVTASVVRVVQGLADWAEEPPDALLQLEVWLRPETSSNTTCS